MILLSFYTGLRNMAAMAQASCAAVLDFTVGSPFRALLEACMAVVMWLQWELLQLMANIRAATAQGSALDSWMADFSFVRLPGVQATGTATFARYAPVQPALLPLGAQAKTADGSQTFTVAQDTNNPLWNAGLSGYLLPALTGSVTVPVYCAVPGVSGNIQAGTLTLISTPLPGIDTVANAAPFVNGVDPETDPAFRSRFALYVAGLRGATLDAVESAIAGVQQGLVFAITEGVANDGTPTPGYFNINIDDGTGSPSATLLAAVTAAVNNVRGLGLRFGVFGPVTDTVAVSLQIGLAPGYQAGTVYPQVQTAIVAFGASLPIGATLALTRIAQVAYNTSPGVLNVNNITINGGVADIQGVPAQTVRIGSVTIT